MQKTPCTWVLLADNRQGRLLVGTRTHRGSPHFEEVAQIHLEDETQHGSKAGHEKPGHRNGTTANDSRERLQRSARELASWLHKETLNVNFDKIQVFAPTRLCNALHRYASPRLRRRLNAHSGDYSWLSTGQLAQHPRFRPLVPEQQHRQGLGA